MEPEELEVEVRIRSEAEVTTVARLLDNSDAQKLKCGSAESKAALAARLFDDPEAPTLSLDLEHCNLMID